MKLLWQGWQVGARVVRSTPWAGLLGVSLAAVLLLTVGARMTSLVPIIVFLGLSTCGGAAAYLLDEEAASIADASPTARSRRVAWRLLLLVIPFGTAVVGLFSLDRQEPSAHWWRLLPMAVGALGVGVASAAIMRRRGSATPGDFAASVTALGVVLLCTIDPLRRWVSLVPLGSTLHEGRSVALWAAITVGCAATTAFCSRDPAIARTVAVTSSVRSTHPRADRPLCRRH